MFPINNFESGFSGFSGLQWTSSFLAQCLFVKDYFSPFFSPMCYTSAGGFAIKAPFTNNLPTQTNDVIVNPENPENPDSNTQLLRA
jgi:ABC-type phosphate/phosphonate transport system permease subunit